ncbi:MAG TPA: cupin domain-containing protein [Chloroflexota bacterium]|jgi:mannose-6-phosphate isomerase-like protein (cupin superfamily)|nr:cupin domain-containing protein [Chloroflexota bacterium]
MAAEKIYRVPVVSKDDPSFALVATRIDLPQRDPERAGQFWPALSGFTIGSGSTVDISYLESTNRAPNRGFDRHLHSDELFVCLEGEFLIPMAPCRSPDDLDEEPRLEDIRCYHIKAGELFVLKRNTWHNGGWPAPGAEKMRYLMILSGHRAGAGHGGREDHVMKYLPEGQGIAPDV